MRQIAIATAFTPTPAGRYRTDGPFSGQRFRDELLLPPLRAGEVIELNLDGVVSLPSSFWEEAIGGLIRSGIDREVLKERFRIKTTDPLLAMFAPLAQKFMNDAERTLH